MPLDTGRPPIDQRRILENEILMPRVSNFQR